MRTRATSVSEISEEVESMMAAWWDEQRDELSTSQWTTLEKSWAAIDYLAGKAGVPGETLILSEEDMVVGSHDSCLFFVPADKVRLRLPVLEELPFERLISFYDAADMTERDVYPGIWDRDPEEEGIFSWLEENFADLRLFWAAAARNGDGIAILLQ